jgi:hypothetical protein
MRGESIASIVVAAGGTVLFTALLVAGMLTTSGYAGGCNSTGIPCVARLPADSRS